MSELLLALGLGLFIAFAIEYAKAVVDRPHLERSRALREAATARLRPRTMLRTRLLLEDGAALGSWMGWRPGVEPGEVITYLSKRYEVIEARTPNSNGEATLVVKLL